MPDLANSSPPEIEEQIRELAARHGLKVTSARRSPERNRAVGGAPRSYHLTGQAVDVSGSPEKMTAFAKEARRDHGDRLSEVFYDPVGGYKNGRDIGAIGGHSDHVHVSWGPSRRGTLGSRAGTEDVGSIRRRLAERTRELIGGTEEPPSGEERFLKHFGLEGGAEEPPNGEERFLKHFGLTGETPPPPAAAKPLTLAEPPTEARLGRTPAPGTQLIRGPGYHPQREPISPEIAAWRQSHPGSLRPSTPAETAATRARDAAEERTPLLASDRARQKALGDVGGFLGGMIVPNTARVLNDPNARGADLDIALASDFSILRAAGLAAKTAQGVVSLTKLGKAWLAKTAAATPGKAAAMRLLDPSRAAGAAAGAAAFQTGIETPQNKPFAQKAVNVGAAAVAGPLVDVGIRAVGAPFQARRATQQAAQLNARRAGFGEAAQMAPRRAPEVYGRPTAPAPQPTAPAEPPHGFAVGDRVRVMYGGQPGKLTRKITAVHPDGTVTIEGRARPVHHQELRATKGVPAPETPAAPAPPSPGSYNIKPEPEDIHQIFVSDIQKAAPTVKPGTVLKTPEGGVVRVVGEGTARKPGSAKREAVPAGATPATAADVAAAAQTATGQAAKDLGTWKPAEAAPAVVPPRSAAAVQARLAAGGTIETPVISKSKKPAKAVPFATPEEALRAGEAEAKKFAEGTPVVTKLGDGVVVKRAAAGSMKVRLESGAETWVKTSDAYLKSPGGFPMIPNAEQAKIEALRAKRAAAQKARATAVPEPTAPREPDILKTLLAEDAAAPKSPTEAAHLKTDAAKAELKAALDQATKRAAGPTKPGMRRGITPLLDPNVQVKAVRLAAAYIEEGAVHAHEWAKRMAAEVPEVWEHLKEHVETIHRTAYQYLAARGGRKEVPYQEFDRATFVPQGASPTSKTAPAAAGGKPKPTAYPRATPEQIEARRKADAKRPNKETMVGSVNLNRLDIPDEAKAVLREDYTAHEPEIVAVRRGVQHDKDVDEAAKRLIESGWTPPVKAGSTLNNEQQRAAASLYARHLVDTMRTHRRWLQTGKTEDQIAYEIAKQGMLAHSLAYQGAGTEAGRALGIRNRMTTIWEGALTEAKVQEFLGPGMKPPAPGAPEPPPPREPSGKPGLFQNRPAAPAGTASTTPTTPAPGVRRTRMRLPSDPDYGAANKLITRKRYEADLISLKEKMNAIASGKAGARLLGMPPPELLTILPELSRIGMFHVEAGTREFGAWAREIRRTVQRHGYQLNNDQVRQVYDAMEAETRKRLAGGSKMQAEAMGRIKGLLKSQGKAWEDEQARVASALLEAGEDPAALVKLIESETHESGATKASKALFNTMNVMRELMAMGEESPTLRQGLPIVVRHPFIAGRALARANRAFFLANSRGTYEKVMTEIVERPTWDLMRKSGLYLARTFESGLRTQEELMKGSIVKRIPIVGGIAKRSEHAAVIFLNRSRADVFDSVARAYFRRGMTFETHPQAFKDLAQMVNIYTGRGNLGKAEALGEVLSNIGFAPRFAISRPQQHLLFAKALYSPSMTPELRKEIVTTYLAQAGAVLSVLALVKTTHEMGLHDADVEWDMRSSDFGKIRIGKIRVDIGAGHMQWITMLSRVLTGETKSLSGQVRKQSPVDTVSRFLSYKSHPAVSLAIAAREGKEVTGEPLTGTSPVRIGKTTVQVPNQVRAVGRRISPIYLQDMIQVWKELGPVGAIPLTAGAFFGVGVNAYQDQSTPRQRGTHRPHRSRGTR